MSPSAHTDGHDAPRLVAQFVPGVATQIDDLIVGFEDSVREPVVTHELPDVFDGVQFGRLRRQGQDGDVFGHLQFRRRMPTGLIENENGMRVRIDGGTDRRQMGVHRLGIAPGQDKTDAFALLRTDRPKDIGRLGALIAWCAWPCSAFGPAPRQLVLLADPRLVLKPDFDRYARMEARADRRQLGGEVFLNASTANSFCA
jgi:hypothetical protein